MRTQELIQSDPHQAHNTKGKEARFSTHNILQANQYEFYDHLR